MVKGTLYTAMINGRVKIRRPRVLADMKIAELRQEIQTLLTTRDTDRKYHYKVVDRLNTSARRLGDLQGTIDELYSDVTLAHRARDKALYDLDSLEEICYIMESEGVGRDKAYKILRKRELDPDLRYRKSSKLAEEWHSSEYQ